jgi:lathosterol oxidase
MSIPDLSSPAWFLITIALFFVIVVGRYVLVSGLFYGIFYIWFPKRWEQRKLGNKQYTTAQLKREIAWSTVTAVIFSLTGTMILFLWQKGYTKIYTDIGQYAWWWLPVSLGISMLIDESYYYWVHRLLHNPKVFKKIHRIHHQSNITSPWTAFAFHPAEGLMLAVVLPVTLMIVPMHPFVILTQLAIMTFTSVINHLDIEIYPQKFNRHAIGRWLIGATHHSLHHRQFKYNYGLYFTFWDKWQKTESPLFDATFESATKKKD